MVTKRSIDCWRALVSDLLRRLDDLPGLESFLVLLAVLEFVGFGVGFGDSFSDSSSFSASVGLEWIVELSSFALHSDCLWPGLLHNLHTHSLVHRYALCPISRHFEHFTFVGGPVFFCLAWNTRAVNKPKAMLFGRGSLRDNNFTITSLSPFSQLVNLPLTRIFSRKHLITYKPRRVSTLVIMPSSADNGMFLILIFVVPRLSKRCGFVLRIVMFLPRQTLVSLCPPGYQYRFAIGREPVVNPIYENRLFE